MNREQAEKLLAALIFDDLDEASKAELLAYLQSDDELRDRLADMRMAAKLTCDAVKDGPDPVLSERRLAQLKRLANAGTTRGRIFTMRRFLAAAAVLMFGLVFVGLLTPSLSRRSATFSSVPAMDKARVGWSELRAPMPMESPGLKMDRSSLPAQQTDRSGVVADSTVSSGGGIYPGVVGNRTPAVAGRRNIEIIRGPSVYSYETTQDADVSLLAGQSSSPAPITRIPEPSKELRNLLMSRAGNEPLEQVTSEMSGKPYTDQPLSGPVPMDGSLASAKRSGGPVNEEEVRRRLVRVKSAEAGAESRYGRPGTVTSPKPPAPTPAPLIVDSFVSSDKKQDTYAGVGGAVEADRVPVLGDKPIVGKLFRESVSEVKKDLSYGGLREQRGKAEGPSGTSSVRLNEVQDKVTFDLNESLGQVVEGAEAGVPSPSHFRVVPVNPWVMTDRDSLSTFALDVDTASYALCRRYIRGGFLPPIGAVRMEEFINAFDYAYPQRDDATFAVYAEGAPSPFAPEGQDLTLLKIAVKARTAGRDQRRAAHLVFVVDASASMGQADRLPVVQSALNLLVDKLSDVDRISLITCANEARLHLEAVPAQQKDAIRQAIDAIQPAGPTNLMAGLRLGYAMARKAFVAGRINQVVLCSDGVANVGQTEAEAVLQEVAGDRKQGIALTCVGVGYGAYNDAFLEAMADRGDGRYVFLDSSEEARETLVGQLAATLQTVARDARIQVQFSPVRVRRYRLIGYENRDIEDQRFRDDTVDAGEVGSGQCSTALYELELTAASSGDGDSDLGTVFVRYRDAETGQVEEISRSLAGSLVQRRSVEEDPRFFLAAGAARFAEWLRQSEHAQYTALIDVQRLLDQVSAALPLDRDVRDLAALAHRTENLPRAPQP
jgi:Ca-activated chloride channel family protein